MKRFAARTTLILCSLFLATQLPAQDSNREKPSLQSLINDLKDGDKNAKRDAAHTLARFGPEAAGAIDELIKAVDDDDIQVAGEAIQALAHLGKTAETALDALLGQADSRDEQRRYRIAHAIGRIGASALPTLSKRLDDGSNEVREVVVRALGWIGPESADLVPNLINRLDDSDETVRQCAIDSLGKVGPAATDSLIEALASKSSKVKIGAANSLALIGGDASDAIEHFVRLASDSEPETQAAMINALGRVGREHEAVLDPLSKALQGDNLVAQQAAVESFVRISPKLQTRAAEKLASLLGDSKNVDTTQRVAMVLGSYGKRAELAVPKLLKAAVLFPEEKSITEAVGRVGASALSPTIDALKNRKITTAQVNQIVDGMPAMVKQTLAQKTDDDDPLVREVATQTITKVVPLPKNSLDLLQARLQDDAANVRRAAAESFSQLGSRAKEKLDAIMEVSRAEQDTETLASMIGTIANLQTDRKKLATFLSDFALNEHKSIQLSAIRALGDQAKLSKSLHESLAEAAGSSDEEIRSAAIRAIVKTSGNREATTKIVVAAIEDESQLVREQALTSVADLGKAAKTALATIAKQLSDDAPTVRIAAIESLARLERVARPSFDKVVKLYEDKDTTVRMTVVKSVRNIEDDAEKLLPTLIKAIEDSEWEVRQQAAYELGEMEEDATPAIPALLKMLRRDDESDAARRAIREINTAGDEALPMIMEIVTDDSSGRRSRYYALYLLRKMGSRAKSTLPKLRELRDAANARTREYYDRAIKDIEEDDDE